MHIVLTGKKTTSDENSLGGFLNTFGHSELSSIYFNKYNNGRPIVVTWVHGLWGQYLVLDQAPLSYHMGVFF